MSSILYLVPIKGTISQNNPLHIDAKCKRSPLCHDTIISIDVRITLRRDVHSTHQYFGEVANQITLFQIINFSVSSHQSVFCNSVEIAYCIWTVYCDWIIQHILVTWNRKIGDLVGDFTKNWWLEWISCLTRFHRLSLKDRSYKFWTKSCRYRNGIDNNDIHITRFTARGYKCCSIIISNIITITSLELWYYGVYELRI